VIHFNNKRLNRNLSKCNTPIQFKEKSIHLSDHKIERHKKICLIDSNKNQRKWSGIFMEDKLFHNN